MIIVTLHTKVLQGHFTQINAKTLQMLRNNHTIVTFRWMLITACCDLVGSTRHADGSGGGGVV